MAATYQKKYWFQYVPLDSILIHRVELWQLTESALTAVEVDSMASPFIVEMPELENKQQVVRGRGCEINLLSPSDSFFFDGLYHVDKREFIVKHYIDDEIDWLGYLNTEMMREGFTHINNYEVQVSGNDGFSLSERINFLDTDGSHYTGIKSKFEILKIILQRIALPYEEIRIALSTTFAGFSGLEDKTILHESYMDCANFYNEDGDAETMRKVLESILAPYFCFIIQESGNVVITDIHLIATGDNITYQRFNGTTYGHINNEIINPKKIIDSIGYMGTGSDKERSGGKNKQVVVYSPYPQKEVIGESVNSIGEFELIDLSWSTKFNILYKTLTQNKYWNGLAEVTKWYADEVVYYANLAAFPNYGEDDKTYVANDTTWHYRWNGLKYLRVDATILFGAPENIHMIVSGNLVNTMALKYRYAPVLVLPSSTTQTVGSELKISSGSAIIIKGEIGITIDNHKVGHFTRRWRNRVISLTICLKIKIGDNYYSGIGANAQWSTSEGFFYSVVSDADEAPWENNIMEIPGGRYGYADDWSRDFKMIKIGNDGNDGIIINIGKDLSGILEIEVWSDMSPFMWSRDGWSQWHSQWSNTDFVDLHPIAWYRKLFVDITDSEGGEVSDKDVEYVGYLDPLFKDEGEKVTLLCGTESSASDRAKILWMDNGTYRPIREWTRAFQTFKIEELLLNSLCSNYRAGYLTLSNMNLKNGFNHSNVLTDSFTGTSKFMVKSSKVNYRDNLNECALIEVFPDELTIVKS